MTDSNPRDPGVGVSDLLYPPSPILNISRDRWLTIFNNMGEETEDSQVVVDRYSLTTSDSEEECNQCMYMIY